MPVLTSIRNLFRKADDQPPIINHPLPRGNKPEISVRVVGTLGSPMWSQRTYESLAREGYQHNADVYSCISLIATAAKQTQWDLSRSQESINLMSKAAGSSAAFIEAWISYILLSGNAYIEIGRNAVGVGAPTSVYLLQPNRVTAKTNIEKTSGVLVSPYREVEQEAGERQPRVQMWDVRDMKGRPYPVEPKDMVHSRLFNPLDQIYGMAPLEAALLQVDAQNEGSTLMKRLLQSGHVPGWIEAAHDSEWGDTQVAQLRERFRSSKEQMDTPFLQNAIYHPVGFQPVDSGVSEQQVLSKRDIASVFHVPPQLIGDTQSQTYSNYQQARLALYMEAVFPLLVQFVEDWNKYIGEPLRSKLEVDKDSFEAVTAARHEGTDRVHKLWTSGVITQNEARKDLNYKTVAGGDVFYAPANFLPLGGAETEEAPGS
jgi:HK97 family phage portal protein